VRARGASGWAVAVLATLTAALAFGACSGGGSAKTEISVRAQSAAAGAGFDFGRAVGLVEGDRPESLWLMIADSTLAAGDSLTLIADEPEPDPDSPPDILTAAVAERMQRNPHAKMTAGPNDSFYRLVSPPGALNCCIFGYAVRAPRRDVRVVAGRAEADLDRDGVPEHFQSCASTEGLHPTVWSGEPLRGVNRWTRYYYLGYDVEPTCPELDSASTPR